MPLSDHEQRLLEQIERALYAEDPKFASTVRSTDLRHYYRRRVVRAGLVFLVGVGVIVGGLITSRPPVLYAGAALAAIGLALTVIAWRRLVHGESRLRPVPAAAPRPRASFRARMEERWQRRWDERNL